MPERVVEAVWGVSAYCRGVLLFMVALLQTGMDDITAFHSNRMQHSITLVWLGEAVCGHHYA